MGVNIEFGAKYIDYNIPFGALILSSRWDLDLEGFFDDFSDNGT
jgi:hypothetical protein